MQRKIFSIVASILLIITVFTIIIIPTDALHEQSNTISEDYIPSETPITDETEDLELEIIKLDTVKVGVVKPITLEEAQQLLESTNKRLLTANEVYNGLIELGYKEDHPAIVMILAEIDSSQQNCDYYKTEYANLKEQMLWDKRAKEYPEATKIWLYMKELGWSDVVCAGIMGNLMAEVGGQTLNIQYYLYDPTGQYYGICQWAKKYYGEIHGADLDQQCDYLRDTIQYQYNEFGYLYQKGMNYDEFLKMTNPSEAALCFAKVYERCHSRSHEIRQSNAQKAYDYFTGE